jgi:hypothetical protein
VRIIKIKNIIALLKLIDLEENNGEKLDD